MDGRQPDPPDGLTVRPVRGVWGPVVGGVELRTGHHPALDGMRGVAALTVVIAHAAAFYGLETGVAGGTLGHALPKVAHAEGPRLSIMFRHHQGDDPDD